MLHTVMAADKSAGVYFTIIAGLVLTLSCLLIVYVPLFIFAATALVDFLLFSHVDYCV